MTRNCHWQRPQMSHARCRKDAPSTFTASRRASMSVVACWGACMISHEIPSLSDDGEAGVRHLLILAGATAALCTFPRQGGPRSLLRRTSQRAWAERTSCWLHWQNEPHAIINQIDPHETSEADSIELTALLGLASIPCAHFSSADEAEHSGLEHKN